MEPGSHRRERVEKIRSLPEELVRMKLILTEDHPTLKPYDQDKWAGRYDASRIPVESSIVLLRGLYQRWVELLSSVHEAEWTRGGHHPVDGEVNLENLLTIYARHCGSHVRQIQELRTSRGW